ncbi:MAG TPA: TetR family transcriptional regulator [Amycolatopsis sp.]|nr:TetR family transcriptional regulator [Amycolatopsis sp.]
MPKGDTKVTRKRRRRGSIKAEDIVAGAFEVARRISLDQLSMPILAEHLDVGVTSIYWYFRKKEELLNAMTDVAVDKFVRLLPEVRADDTWQHALVEHFREERAIHREDEILSDLLLIRTSTYSRDATRRVMEQIEFVVAKLVADGFTPDNALLVYNAISVYTRGSIINDRILRLAHAPTLDTGRQRRMTDWSTMPVLDGLVDRYPLAGTSDEDFAFGLDRLVCGFEVLLREQGEAPRKKPARGSASAPAASARPKAATTRKPPTRKAAS